METATKEMETVTKERGIAATKRNDARRNSKKHYNTSCTRSARDTSAIPVGITPSDVKEWMIQEFGFYMDRWTIGPNEARHILDNMHENRALKLTGVSRYVSAMEKAGWKLSPQGLCFDWDLRLLDGQHRLESVVRSGVPTDFVVFIGVPKETPLDKNIPRSDADSLRIRGECAPNISTAANISIVRNFYAVKFSIKASSCMNEDDRGALLNKFADEISFARLTSGKGASHGIASKVGVQVAIFTATICGVDRKKLEEFLISINSVDFDSDSPARAIYRTLSEMKMRGGVNINLLEGMMEEAIFDYVNGAKRVQKYKGMSHPYLDSIPDEEVLL